MPTPLVSSHPRRLIALAIGVAVLAASAVTATVATPDRVLALPGASESTVVAVEPTRVLDTRVNVGLNGVFKAGVSRKLTVTGDVVTYFYPTDTRTTQTVVPVGATGVLLNVTGVAPTARGWIAVRPGSATGLPSTSNLNLLPGSVVPNAVTVAVPAAGSGAGQIDITYGPPSGATVDIIVDIVGYTTNTGLIDLVARVEALETGGVAGPQGPPGAQGPAGAPGADGDDAAVEVTYVSADFTTTGLRTTESVSCPPGMIAVSGAVSGPSPIFVEISRLIDTAGSGWEVRVNRGGAVDKAFAVTAICATATLVPPPV